MAEEEKEGCVHIFHSLRDAFGHPVSSYYGRGKCLNILLTPSCLLRGIHLCIPRPQVSSTCMVLYEDGDAAMARVGNWPPRPSLSLQGSAKRWSPGCVNVAGKAR